MCKDYNAKVFRSISPLNMKRRIRIVSVIQNSKAQNTFIGKGVKLVIKDTLYNVEDIGDLSLKKGTRIKKKIFINTHLPKLLHLFKKRDNGQCDSNLYYTYFCIENSYCILYSMCA